MANGGGHRSYPRRYRRAGPRVRSNPVAIVAAGRSGRVLLYPRRRFVHHPSTEGPDERACHRRRRASRRSARAERTGARPQGRRPRPPRLAVHHRGGLDRRPRPGQAPDGRGRGGVPRGDAPQAARRHPQPAGFRRHQHHRHARPPRRGGSGRCPRLHLHEHDQRLRRRAGAAVRSAGRVDHRGGGAGAEEHLRRHQGRGRGPLPAVPPQPRPAGGRASHRALLPGGGRQPANPRGLRRRQRQGERVPLPPRRPRGRGERPPGRGGAGGGDRLRPLHRQRDDAVPPRGPRRASPRRAGGGRAPGGRRGGRIPGPRGGGV